jgi:hypothetical protein
VPFFLVLVLINAGFQAIPLTTSASQISEADLQRTRCEVIAKSALILAYRPATEHVQAISDLQVVLPRFQQEQTSLATYHNDIVQGYLLQMQPDYLAITNATQNILAQKDKPIDKIQIDIILAHEHNYLSTMNEFLVYGLQRLDGRTMQVFVIECIIDGLLLIIVVLFWIRIELLLRRTSWQQQPT